MMDPSILALIGIFSTGMSAVFGALLFFVRQSREDWKGLYLAEKTDHKDTLKSSSEDNRENAKAIRELSDYMKDNARTLADIQEFMKQLPSRREDWYRSTERRS